MINEISFRPHLTPNSPPKFYNEINRCMKCNGIHEYVKTENGIMHMSCVVLTQDEEGWFQVICAECGNEGIKAASGETAINHWNEQNKIMELKGEI